MGEVRGLITNVDAFFLSGSSGIVLFEGKAYSVTSVGLTVGWDLPFEVSHTYATNFTDISQLAGWSLEAGGGLSIQPNYVVSFGSGVYAEESFGIQAGLDAHWMYTWVTELPPSSHSEGPGIPVGVPTRTNGFNEDASVTHYYTDPTSGEQVRTTVITDINTGQTVGLTTIAGGYVYAAGSLGTGKELNGLEQQAHEAYRRSLAASNALDTAVDTAAGWSHHDPGGPGGGGSSSGNSGGSSSGHSTGGNSGGTSGGSSSTGGSGITSGNELSVEAGIVEPVANPPGTWTGGGTGTPDPGLPINPDYTSIQLIILDMDGDKVEVAVNSRASFDWDGPSVFDPEATNLPDAPRRAA